MNLFLLYIFQIQIDQVSLKCARLQKDISWSEEIDNCLTESINTGNSDINLLQEYNLQDNVKFQVSVPIDSTRHTNFFLAVREYSVHIYPYFIID